ncbi:MAG: type II toxin-antitoxin system RelE/ParE family toxin [Deinococcota bacterium]
MPWHIEYFNERVEKAVLNLPTSLLAKYLRLTDLMFEFGSDLGLPHTKALGDGLFELRVKARDGIARVFYYVVIEQCIVMLHVFIKKSQKTPKKEVDVAGKRMKEVKR